MTHYPRDEFDQVPESGARQGVHRERLIAPESDGLALKIVAGLLVLAVGLAAYFIFPRLGIGRASEVVAETSTTAPAPAPAPTARDAASEIPSETPTPKPAPAEGPTTSEPRGESSGPPSEEPTQAESGPAATVDREQPVAVLNATTVSGLASTAAGRLQAGGWNVTQIGNWPGQQLQGSIVLYGGEEQRLTAEALAGALGIPTVQGNPEFAGDITVVVGPDFQ